MNYSTQPPARVGIVLYVENRETKILQNQETYIIIY